MTAVVWIDLLGFQKYFISTFINPVILSAANLTQKPKAAGFECNLQPILS